MSFWLMAVAGLGLDGLIGDPAGLPHPVIWMGRYIRWFELVVRRPSSGAPELRLLGVVLVLTTAGLFAFLPWWLLRGLNAVSPPTAWALSVWLAATTIAWRGLVAAGQNVHAVLAAADGLPAARRAVKALVGRDTQALDDTGVVRAAVESLAENFVDGIISPVLFCAVGGAPLALLYRAINTLDSMVGYRSPRYRDFGWAAARLDDLLNYVPARLAAVLLWAAAAVQGLHASDGWRSMRRDAKRHPSPNGGLPEAMVAGALGVQLGGLNFYHGVPSERASLGDANRPLEREDISRTVRLVHTATGLLALLVAMGGVADRLCFVR